MASAKAKENKGRQKALPKLKTILANPIKTKCPTLSDEEMQQLHELLLADMKKSGQESRAFASGRHICLGLESSLRAINNRKSSCIFISLSIKPRHLIGLIGRNAHVKDETVPVYVQPQLENFTEAVFGVRALTLVLPKETQQLDADLEKWISTRKRPKKILEIKAKKSNANSQQKHKVVKIKKEVEKSLAATTAALPESSKSVDIKPWSGDFISFSSTGENIQLDKLHLEEDKEHLLTALHKMAEKVKATPITTTSAEAMTIGINIDEENEMTAADETVSDCDDFLDVYKPLTVHKIRPNPEKKPKKKHKKNKNNNKSK